MPAYVEGQSVSFSQNSSVDCSYVSSTWFRRPGLFGRAARLTVTICDELDSPPNFPLLCHMVFRPTLSLVQIGVSIDKMSVFMCPCPRQS